MKLTSVLIEEPGLVWRREGEEGDQAFRPRSSKLAAHAGWARNTLPRKSSRVIDSFPSHRRWDPKGCSLQ